MPKVAFNMGAVEKQVPLKDIPQEILSILTENSDEDVLQL